jgi:signal transduction histidine kinase
VFKDRYQCVVTTCGREGVDYARGHPVDAAILDIKMPDMSGVDVLREIKKIDPNTECIMLTGYETIETARAAVRYGAADYLNKPFDVFAMRELLEKCLARRQQRLAAEDSLRSLQRMNEELAAALTQSNRAVAAGVLSAGVVHEMNNPLSIIAGYSQLLERDLAALGTVTEGSGQKIQQRLAAIQREIERCKDIARRFLTFSRSTAQEKEAVEVGRMLEDTVALLNAHPANRGAVISVAAGDPSLKLRVHPTEIVQVLINLGVNALQAMNGRGTLTFSAARAASAPAEPAFRSPNSDPRRSLIGIAVADTGPGIAPENIQKLFVPYFTTKTQGTGLGLAIVCELVGQYGGLIDVQSQPGHGATFTVYFPLAD